MLRVKFALREMESNLTQFFLKNGFLLLISSLLLACQGMNPSEIEGGILGEGLINGKSNARSAQFAVALRITKGSKTYGCTGSVIGEKLIVTAGHCLEGTNSSSDIDVYRSVKNQYGGWDLEKIGSFNSWIINSQYIQSGFLHSDIALGMLDRPIPGEMKPIKMVDRDWIFSNDYNYVFVGAGSKKPIAEQDSSKRAIEEGNFIGTVNLKYRSNLDLISSKFDFNPISSGGQIVLTTKSLEVTYVCSGDSGGAFIERNEKGEQTLAGVLVATGMDKTPNGDSCNGKGISVVSISVHRKWIDEAAVKLK